MIRMLMATMLLAGCTTVTVRAPPYDPPPIDPELLIACFTDDPLFVPADDSYGEFYRTAVLNMAGPVARCVKRADMLQAVVRDREASREKYKRDSVEPPQKPWWQF